jgi:hypothetical protein
MAKELPEGIGGNANIKPISGPDQVKKTPNKEAFESYMKEQPPSAEESGGKTTNVTPMDLAKTPPQVEKPTPESLANQVEQAQTNYQEIQKKLKSPNLTFKRSDNYLIRNKLNEAKNHLNAAAKKLNAEKPPPTTVPQKAGPVAKFLAMAADGQNQLELTKRKLARISETNKQLKPTDMLLVQVKLAQAQQEIEYTSTLLSQVVRSIQQVLNVQL